MKTNLKFSTLFLACSLVITGCGGGGGSSDSSSQGSNNNTNPSGNNTNPTGNTNPVSAGSSTGTFVDSPVAGLTYTTSGGYTGTTDSSGHFAYNAGETITFKLGTLTLGTVPASGLITPIDLSNSNFNIRDNLLILLQSLDTHANSNAITITPASIAKISSSLDLTVDPTTFSTALQSLSITPVSLTTALTNFQNALSTNSTTSTPTTPLQTAKNFITNANKIIASASQIMQTYQPANLTGTKELGYATNAITVLALNAYQIAGGQSTTLNTAQIQTALNNVAGSQAQYSNLNNLTVSTTSNGTVNISGNFTITYVTDWTYNPTTNAFIPIYSAPITVTVSQFGISTNTNTSNTNFNFTLNANSSITATTSAGINASVVAKSNSSITATYPSAVTLNLSTTMTNTQNNTNPMPQTGSISLKNITLTSGVTTLNLNNLTVSGQSVNVQNTSSTTQSVIVPTNLSFNGSLQQNQSSANVAAQIQLSNLSSSYILGQHGIPTTSSVANTTGNFSLAVSAQILAGSTTHTFNSNFIGNLTGLSSVQSSLELTVDNTSLMGSVTATAATSTQPESIGVTLIDPNGASINIANAQNFTTSNIIVNGSTQGTITKSSSSLYQAKFTDNSIIVIAP